MATKKVVKTNTLTVESVPINSIKEWKANPRKNDDAVPKVAELLKVHGQRSALVVWRKNNTIYKGNTTWKAAKSLGWKNINVHFEDFMDEQNAAEYGVSDNKSSEWSEWDDLKLDKLTRIDDFSFVNAGMLEGNNVAFSEEEIQLNLDQLVEEPEEIKKVKEEKFSDDYTEFLDSKMHTIESKGFEVQTENMNNKLMPFQKDIVKWAVRKGRCAVFSGTGTGKTLIQIEWARLIEEHEKKPVLIVCPLAVSSQTIVIGEGMKTVINQLSSKDNYNYGKRGIYIINYDRVEHIDITGFCAVVLDESSIMKNFGGSIRTMLLEKFTETPFKLCCTATPAPNDYMELGTHAEFLLIMKRQEMLSMYFVHDGGRTSNWRLKGHARNDFYKWLASWAVMFRSPRDLGYNDESVKFFDLPKITYNQIIVKSGQTKNVNTGISGRLKNRQSTINERVNAALLKLPKNKPCIVWCDLNNESAEFSSLTGIQEVKGSDPIELKERVLNDFSSQRVNAIVTKPSIAGFGLNWQHCDAAIFIGLSDSFERYYQAIRRIWRAGQKNKVVIYLIISEIERDILTNIQRKEYEFNKLQEEMLDIMLPEIIGNIKNQKILKSEYKTATVKKNNYVLYLGDCVDVMKDMQDDSIDYSVFSPPFVSLYTYSDSEKDMGNCTDTKQFFSHFNFMLDHLYRVIKPGRNVSIHCMNLPTSKVRNGYIGIYDFRGDLIRAMESKGFIYHSEVTIWKNPVTAMQRTKALGLLHKQLKKDSTMSRQGIPDYVITFRKPGINQSRITHTNESFPIKGIDGWQEAASPAFIIKEEDGTFHSSYDNHPSYLGLWMDINPSNTLQKTSAREYEDERHIAPLQLQVIERCLKLWSKEGDLVLSPFAGIGSEGYISLQRNRRFIGIELKWSYFKQMKLNLELINK